MNVQLLHEAGPMGFGGFDANKKKRSNITSGLAFRDELQNLALAQRQDVVLLVDARTISREDGAGNSRTDIDLTSRDLPNGVNEVTGSLGFENVTGNAGL